MEAGYLHGTVRFIDIGDCRMTKLTASQVSSALRYNDHQDDDVSFITNLQRELGGTVTGAWDEDTVQRIATLQREEKLVVDGKVGPQTRAALAMRFLPVLPSLPSEVADDTWPDWVVPQTRILQEAEAEWRRGTSEDDLSRTGPLAAIFRDAGWSPFGVDVRPGTQQARDWCGMTVAAWYFRGGLHSAHRKSFLATANVRSFFSYGKAGRVHHRTARVALFPDGTTERLEAWHTRLGERRQWVEGAALRTIAGADPSSLPLTPASTILISHNGSLQEAHHIALVESFDGAVLTTLEGNATGTAGNGKTRKDAVVRVTRDLRIPAVLHTLFGIGRPSLLDFAAIQIDYV